jgi:flavodoxin
MENLIIYISTHHGNTKKVAKAMAEVLNAELVKVCDVDITALSKYDLIGFGSGIYWGKTHKDLLSLVDKLPFLKNKKAFVFYTSGEDKSDSDRELREKLLAKGFDIIGAFSCPGWDTWGPLRIFGGKCQGRPNTEDLEKARNFATNLLKG